MALKEREKTALSTDAKQKVGCYVVIDAGHGGEDPGAVSEDGVLEKELNLEIARLLSALLELNCTPVKMTRTDDTLLYDYYDELEDYTGKKKVYDLKNRLKIAEEYESSIYVGIHMNKFQESKYSGTQIYYSKNNPLSRTLAKTAQENIKEYLQPENNRKIKEAGSELYILKNAKMPAILIECGFISNKEELENMKNEEYQKKMCLVYLSSILSVVSKN